MNAIKWVVVLGCIATLSTVANAQVVGSEESMVVPQQSSLELLKEQAKHATGPTSEIRKLLSQAQSSGSSSRYGGGGYGGSASVQSGGFGGGGMMQSSGFGMMGANSYSNEQTEMRVFALQYYDADSMANILNDIFPVGVFSDQRNNQLIVSADENRMAQIEKLIETMDKPESKSSAKDQRNLLYRIYMVEPVVEETNNLREFLIEVDLKKSIDSNFFLQEIESDSLVITNIATNKTTSNGIATYKTTFEGLAKSLDDVKKLSENLTRYNSSQSEISRFEIEDPAVGLDTSTVSVHSNLPNNIKGHLEKLIGNEIQTVGYWFGNSSVSGELKAPIGDWSVSIHSETTGDNHMELEVELSGKQAIGMQNGLPVISDSGPFGTSPTTRTISRSSSRRGRSSQNIIFGGDSTILHNTVQSQIGKPVIIGYNRNVGNGRRMGALVIVPELDTLSTGNN